MTTAKYAKTTKKTDHVLVNLKPTTPFWESITIHLGGEEFKFKRSGFTGEVPDAATAIIEDIEIEEEDETLILEISKSLGVPVYVGNVDNIVERPVKFGLNSGDNLFKIKAGEIIGVHPESVLNATHDGYREKAIQNVIDTFLPD